MEHEGHKVTRARFEENLALKMEDPAFLADISPLLTANYYWEPKAAAQVITERLVALLPGIPGRARSSIGRQSRHRVGVGHS